MYKEEVVLCVFLILQNTMNKYRTNEGYETEGLGSVRMYAICTASTSVIVLQLPVLTPRVRLQHK